MFFIFLFFSFFSFFHFSFFIFSFSFFFFSFFLLFFFGRSKTEKIVAEVPCDLCRGREFGRVDNCAAKRKHMEVVLVEMDLNGIRVSLKHLVPGAPSLIS